MKKLIVSSVLILSLAAIAFAVTYTRQSARVVAFVATPSYDANGAVTGVSVQAIVVQRLINDADATDVRGTREGTQITFDMLDSSIATSNITAAGKTVTYTQLASLIKQAVIDRANAAGTP